MDYIQVTRPFAKYINLNMQYQIGMSPVINGEIIYICTEMVQRERERERSPLSVCSLHHVTLVFVLLSVFCAHRRENITYLSTQPCWLRWGTRPPQHRQRRRPRDQPPTVTQGAAGENILFKRLCYLHLKFQ